MAEGIIQKAGGGAASDECTAAKAQVLSGYTAVTSDSNDEPAAGAMVNQGTKTAALNCGGSYTIPAGYHNGSGKVTANSLASQTSGVTAEDRYVLSGRTYWKDGVKRTGNMTVASVVSFSVAAYSTSQVLCTWKNLAKGPYSGVAICAKTGGYPTSINDNRKYTGVGSNSVLNGTSTAILGGLAAGTTYYFRIWVYCTCSAGDLYSGYLQATCMPTAHGRKAFTSSETFTVPANVRSIDIHCTGGGGCGGSKFLSGDRSPAGGAGGYTAYKKGIAVTPGEILVITVGEGSAQNNYASATMTYGGTSSLARNTTILCSAGGGGNAHNPNGRGENAWAGGHGGSGGGSGQYINSDQGSSAQPAGEGGSNGSAGYGYHWNSQPAVLGAPHSGNGQGTTTREFGEANGALYAGGGGGGGTNFAGGGAGGGGKGGRSPSYTNYLPADGSAGTGGGGGGGDMKDYYTSSKGKGGSGNVIVRW